MEDRVLQWVTAITVGALALLLVGGSVVGWILGRDLPQWLALADGAIITGAFGTGAFFAQARASAPVSQHLALMSARYHELAMASATETTPTGGTVSETPGGKA